MFSKQTIIAVAILGVFSGFGCATETSTPRTVAAVFETSEGQSTAPFGDKVTENIRNYTRIAPNVGMAGKLTEAGVREAKAHGFALIIDLRQPGEDGVDMEKRVTAEIDLPYRNIPLSRDDAILAEVEEIAALLDDAINYPILVHCGSANRAGAFWALYRAGQGIDKITAIEEGRAAGMTSREPQIRELLGLPALLSEE